METVGNHVRKSVGMNENKMNLIANIQMKNKKMKIKLKNKRRRRGQNKNQGIKVHLKNKEKLNSNKDVGKNNVEEVESLVKAEDEEQEPIGEEQTNTGSDENMEHDVQKPKKPKRRNNRDFKFPSVKMELTPLLTQETEGRTSHRDERTLYVRFPPSLLVREKSYIEPMVPSAVDIRFPRLSPGSCAKFCYVEFETEEETTKMKENLSNIKINGEAFYADYVGKKSKAYSEKEPRTVDPLRLYVGGLPKGIQASDIRTVFPTATRMLYRKASHKVSVSHAYLVYETHEEALSVFKASKGLKIRGKEVIVMFATYKNNTTNKKEDELDTPATKRQKVEDGKDDGSNMEMDAESEDKEKE